MSESLRYCMHKIKILLLLAISSILLFKAQLIYCHQEDSCTLLMQAIQDKKSALEIGHLIAQGADVNAIDCEFLRKIKPVLRYALDRGTDPESVEIIRMLIEAGADVNQLTYNRVTDKRLYGIMPLLTYAAIYSSAEVVQILLEVGATDAVVKNSDSLSFKKTALRIAQELGKTDIINVLNKKVRL